MLLQIKVLWSKFYSRLRLVILEKQARGGLTLKICDRYIPLSLIGPLVKPAPSKHMNTRWLTTVKRRLFHDSLANFCLCLSCVCLRSGRQWDHGQGVCRQVSLWQAGKPPNNCIQSELNQLCILYYCIILRRPQTLALFIFLYRRWLRGNAVVLQTIHILIRIRIG